MSQITPTSLCAEQLESQVNGANNSGNTDILHFISNGEIVSWVDFDGFPGGNLNTGGGSSGVSSVNSETGALTITGSGLNTVTTVGSNINVAGNGVSSVNAEAGAIVLAAGANQTITQVGNVFTFAAAATSTSIPWADIQNFGARPHKFAFNQPTAGTTTISGSPNVTLSTSGALYQSLQNGQGVCLWAAGQATTQTTPVAPTVTTPAVTGSQVIKYQIVGYDALGGLTAASPAGTTTTGPAVFSPLPVTITSITASGGTVTATFSGPLNTTVVAGMTIHIVGVTGAGSGWNGVWQLANVNSTSSITYTVSGATGTGTISASSTGRLSNSQTLSAISRAANGVVTVTTNQSHNFNVDTSAGFAPTVVIIENCSPNSLNGYWKLASTPTANTFTVATGIYSAVSGSVTPGSSTATVWEFNVVACPQLSGTTIGYYIYSDSPSPGGAVTLIGKVPYGDTNFTDFGQCFLHGYGAPGYVPTTPPASAQNQMLSTTIQSGGGTVNLVLNANAGISIGTFGATLMYDDGPNLNQALVVASGNTATSASVLLSPPNSNSDFSGYIFNSPITIPQNVNITFACEAIINETWTYQAFNQVNAQFGSSAVATPAFGTQNFCEIAGIANPTFFLGENLGNTGGVEIDGLGFVHSVNGQTSIIDSCFYTRIANCGFKSNLANSLQGNNMAIIYLGSATLGEVENLNWAITNRFYGNGVPGQSAWSPVQLPAIWFRGSANTAIPNYNDNTGSFTFRGKHSAVGRGICFDHQYSHGNGNQTAITIGAAIWLQQGITPIVTLSGDIFSGFGLKNILNDTSNAPTLANLGVNTHDISVENSSVGNGYSVVCGNPITNLVASGNTLQLAQQLQRTTAVQFTTTSASSDVVFFPNLTSSSIVTIGAVNSSAAADLANATIVSQGTNTITIGHSTASGEIFNLIATVAS